MEDEVERWLVVSQAIQHRKVIEFCSSIFGCVGCVYVDNCRTLDCLRGINVNIAVKAADPLRLEIVYFVGGRYRPATGGSAGIG